MLTYVPIEEKLARARNYAQNEPDSFTNMVLASDGTKQRIIREGKNPLFCSSLALILSKRSLNKLHKVPERILNEPVVELAFLGVMGFRDEKFGAPQGTDQGFRCDTQPFLYPQFEDLLRVAPQFTTAHLRRINPYDSMIVTFGFWNSSDQPPTKETIAYAIAGVARTTGYYEYPCQSFPIHVNVNGDVIFVGRALFPLSDKPYWNT